MQAHPTTDTAKPKRRRCINPQPLEALNLPDALLTPKTVSAAVGLSVASIYRKLAANEFPQPIRLGARCTRFRAADVRSWLQSRAS